MVVKQINHLLTLLELFAREQRPMTLTQIAEELGLPKSSTHNLIDTLSSRGYLYVVRPRGGVYPSGRLHSIATSIYSGDQVISLISGLVDQLATECGETALLAGHAGNETIYLCVAESTSPVRYFASVGDKRPVYATSGGKAILSTYDESGLDAEIAKIDFTHDGPNTIRDPETLKRNIAEGRARGYFLNESEFTPQVIGIGIPLCIDGRRLALSLAGPVDRLNERLDELADRLRETVQAIVQTIDAARVQGRQLPA